MPVRRPERRRRRRGGASSWSRRPARPARRSPSGQQRCRAAADRRVLHRHAQRHRPRRRPARDRRRRLLRRDRQASTKAQTGLANWYADFPHPGSFLQQIDGTTIQPTTNNGNYGEVDDPVINKEIAALLPEPDLDAVADRWAALDRAGAREVVRRPLWVRGADYLHVRPDGRRELLDRPSAVRKRLLELLPEIADSARVGQSPWRLALRRLRRDRIALAFGVLFVVLVLAALAAPLWASGGRRTATADRTNETGKIEVDGRSGRRRLARRDADRAAVARRVLPRRRRQRPRRHGAPALRRTQLAADRARRRAADDVLATIVGLVAGYFGRLGRRGSRARRST